MSIALAFFRKAFVTWTNELHLGTQRHHLVVCILPLREFVKAVTPSTSRQAFRRRKYVKQQERAHAVHFVHRGEVPQTVMHGVPIETKWGVRWLGVLAVNDFQYLGRF